jgi:hypothetical protein
VEGSAGVPVAVALRRLCGDDVGDCPDFVGGDATRMTVCSIEGCEKRVQARGWCTTHYGRWQKYGDPVTLHSRLRGNPNSPVTSTRWIRGEPISYTEDGRTFTGRQRKRGDKIVPVRYYGEVFVCESCRKESFARYSGANRFKFCSHACAGAGDKKLGRVKKTTPTAVKSHLDRLYSVIVRAPGLCVNCAAASDHQCAHGFSRRYLIIRWDLRNGFCLCRRCHMKYTHRPLEWDEWLRDRWGQDLYSELRTLALRTDIKVDVDAVRDHLVAEARSLGAVRNRLPKTVAGWAGLTDAEVSPWVR